MTAGRKRGPDSSRADGSDADEPPDGSPVPPPGEVFDRVPTGTTLRTELAAAARSRGRTSSVASDLVALRDSLAAVDAPEVDLAAARKRLADATGAEDRLTERVATLRGDVRARRAVDADVEAALADLRDAAAALSDAQTERIAAEQALERARERAAEARDARERRLELRDRLRNRERDARTELAAAVYPAFRRALSAVPGGDPADAGAAPSAYAGAPLAGSLAAVRIAAIDGPVALGPAAADAFDPPTAPAPADALDVAVARPDP